MNVFQVPPRRTGQLKIMIAPEEKAHIESVAEKHGMNLSDLVRNAVNEYIEKLEKTKKK